ncbi:retrovirus-related pol polyprotein from transposon TNT 1-94 [Tanacetum coccineum]
MTTLAEFMILSGGDNRPPMLEKDLYDSWKSIMELYMQNREHGRMILESVELRESLQQYYLRFTQLINDINIYKMKLEQFQVNTKFLNSLSPEWRRQSSFVAGTSGTWANILGTRGNNSGQQRVVKCFNCQGEGHMERQCPKPKRKRDATWFRDKVLLVEAQGSRKVLNEEELEFLAYPRVAEAKAVLMANLSSYESNVLSEVPHSDNTHNDMLNESVQEMQYSKQTHLDTYSYAQQDAMILSVFEQLSNQVINYNKVNKDNLMANESLSAELERYKEQFADFEKETKSLKQTLSKQLKEKESLTKTFNVFKNESKEKEAKNTDKEIALEKKVKELDNIVYKMGQSAQTMHMLTKPQDFGKHFIPQQELSDEQAFRLQTLHSNTNQSASSPVKIEAPRELPKITPDALTEGEWEFEHTKAVFLKEIIPFLKTLKDIFNVFDKDLLNEVTKVQTIFNQMEAAIQQYLVDKQKLKGNDIVDNASQVSNATTIAPGMYKIDPVTLAPKDKNNREAHIYYLKHTMEQDAILREIVEQAKSLNPLDSVSYFACKYVKLIQELLGYVRDTCPDIHKPGKKLVAVTPINNKKIVSSMFDARHELYFLKFVYDMNASSKSKSIKKAKKKEEWKPTGKVITATNKVPLREPIPLEVVAQESVVTKVVQIVVVFGLRMLKAHDWRSLSAHQFCSHVSRYCQVWYDQIAKIMGYSDYQIGNITISRVYYVEGLGHNVFFVGQFYDSDLEVAFRKHTCFVCNMEGVNFLSGSWETNLYTLSIGDMMASSPICLSSKTSKTKSWLWHRRLSHLNFGAINHLAKNGLVRGLPKLKFEKVHLCSACAMGKSKKQSRKPKSEDTNQEKLYLLHIDLCGPMHVASINGKNYILVVVDD